MARGKLVVFEGAEGAGKSTQIRLLGERMKARGVPNVTFREPGGTQVGDAVRSIVLAQEGEIAPAAEALLFIASRAELIARQVRPALDAGSVVILDRFFLSTYAYQIAGRGLPEAGIRAANQLATAGVIPDMTILLDISASEGMTRAAQRGGRDRVEKAGDEFHQRVNEAFSSFTDAEWQRTHPECGRIVRIDGVGSEQQVAASIDVALAPMLGITPVTDNRVAS
ncbi:MAG: dTMP kinase [Gemmatimonadaceae bacterium]|nr:dTMP kinase [Gemmatimonadaceae bacterium]